MDDEVAGDYNARTRSGKRSKAVSRLVTAGRSELKSVLASGRTVNSSEREISAGQQAAPGVVLTITVARSGQIDHEPGSRICAFRSDARTSTESPTRTYLLGT